MYLGCIADDFTGAGDAGSFLQKGGMRVLLVNGIPKGEWPPGVLEEVDAVVVALKSRAEKPEKAVCQSLAAARWLKKAGAKQIYVKYCSTFDSTKEGNIGPVCDAVLAWSGAPYTLVCPSLPANRRTVKKGVLYVDGVPLEESPMRFHPVNPMKKSRIKDLMEAQSRYPCYEVGKVRFPEEGLAGEERGKRGGLYYLIPDYEDDRDGRAIVERFGGLPVLTGGSGLCEPLAEHYREKNGKVKETACKAFPSPAIPRFLALAGSCSKATQGQVKAWGQSGWDSCRIDPVECITNPGALKKAEETIAKSKAPFLIYSLDMQEGAGGAGGYSQREKSEALDLAFSKLAVYARQQGVNRLVVAGGETSGAVVKALGYDSFYIGKSIAPGIPILAPRTNPGFCLALKSGNFGGENFFLEAIGEMG